MKVREQISKPRCGTPPGSTIYDVTKSTMRGGGRKGVRWLTYGNRCACISHPGQILFVNLKKARTLIVFPDQESFTNIFGCKTLSENHLWFACSRENSNSISRKSIHVIFHPPHHTNFIRPLQLWRSQRGINPASN